MQTSSAILKYTKEEKIRDEPSIDWYEKLANYTRVAHQGMLGLEERCQSMPYNACSYIPYSSSSIFYRLQCEKRKGTLEMHLE
jgi:hypothetical protein